MTLVGELTDTLNDKSIWSEEIRMARSPTSAPQIQMVNSLARALRVSVAESPGLAELLYQDGSATRLLARAWSNIYRIPLTKDRLRTASEDFREIITGNDCHGYALAGLAVAYLNSALNGWSERPDEDKAFGRQFAERAVACESRLSEAHFALGLSHCAEFRMLRAKAEFSEAMKLDQAAGAATQLSYVELLLGNPRRALSVAREALMIRSDDPGRSFLAFVEGSARLFLKDFEAATSHFENALALNPDLVDPRFFLAAAAHRAGRTARGKEALTSFLDVQPHATIASLRCGRVSKEARYQPYIESVYEALAELGLPETSAPAYAVERCRSDG